MKQTKLVTILFALVLLLAGCGNNEDKYALVDLSAEEMSSADTTKETVTLKEKEEYLVHEIPDENLEKGKKVIVQKGQDGESEVVYEITKQNGVEISRNAISEKIIKRSVPEIVHVGMKGEKKAETGEESSATKVTPAKNRPQGTVIRPSRPSTGGSYVIPSRPVQPVQPSPPSDSGSSVSDVPKPPVSEEPTPELPPSEEPAPKPPVSEEPAPEPPVSEEPVPVPEPEPEPIEEPVEVVPPIAEPEE